MSLLQLTDICLAYSATPLFNKANLQIHSKERVCILGRNGAGKSTLLKLINNEIHADSGNISKQQGLIITKLEQTVPDSLEGTIHQIITNGLGKKGQLVAEYEQLNQLLSDEHSTTLLDKLHKVQQRIDDEHAWDLQHKIANIVSILQLNANDNFCNLSGGQKRRVLLGKALALEPNVLLLDEPTNHLDIESIAWLESFIKSFNGTVIFITHDRTFLQNIATRIVEIDRGIIRDYPGNYAKYLIRKEQELDAEATENKLFDKRLAEEEVWIRQGIKARRTRNEGRVRALKKMRQEQQARHETLGKAKMQIQDSKTSGKIVIEAEDINHSYQDTPIIKNFSTTIMRGDKVGLIGPNGIGKSTLLKILLGEITPTSGKIRHGTKLEIAYFDQLREGLDEKKTVADNVSYGDQFIDINGKQTHILGYLKDFLFTPDRARSPVKMLSGGERNRLLLARLFTKPANVIVLDEPTNDLDLETLELLEELLLQYEGTLLLISHDRSFLNNIVTSTIAFLGNGKLQEFVGGYDDYLRQCPSLTPAKKVSPKTVPKKSDKIDQKAERQKQKEISTVEKKIEKLELAHADLLKNLADPDIYDPANKDLRASLQAELTQTEKQLELLMEKWEELIG